MSFTFVSTFVKFHKISKFSISIVVKNNWKLVFIISIMKRKLKQCQMVIIPPITTKWTITSQLNSLNTKKTIMLDVLAYMFPPSLMVSDMNSTEMSQKVSNSKILTLFFIQIVKQFFFTNVDLVYVSLKLWVNTENEIFFLEKGQKGTKISIFCIQKNCIWELRYKLFIFFISF